MVAKGVPNTEVLMLLMPVTYRRLNTLLPKMAALVGCGVTTGYGSSVRTANIRPGEDVAIVGVGGVWLIHHFAAPIPGGKSS